MQKKEQTLARDPKLTKRLETRFAGRVRQVNQLTLFGALTGVTLSTGLGVVLSRSISGRIRRPATQLGLGGEHAATAARQVAAASRSLAEVASERSAALEETGATIEEMHGTNKNNSCHALSAKHLAARTRLAEDAGVNEKGAMSRAMCEIEGSSDSLDANIAFQAKLLAPHGTKHSPASRRIISSREVVTASAFSRAGGFPTATKEALR